MNYVRLVESTGWYKYSGWRTGVTVGGRAMPKTSLSLTIATDIYAFDLLHHKALGWVPSESYKSYDVYDVTHKIGGFPTVRVTYATIVYHKSGRGRFKVASCTCRICAG